MLGMFIRNTSDPAASQVTSIIEHLDKAAGYEFEPALPKITASLDVIRAHRETGSGGGGAQ